MKENRRIRKQLQAYLCMLVMAVQSLTPVIQVSSCAGRRDGNKKWRGCCDSIRTGNHTGDTNL